MATRKIELTVKQQGMLNTLSQETGEPVDALLDKALEDLQERIRAARANGNGENRPTEEMAKPDEQATQAPKPVWELFAEAFEDIPDEELEKLPTDLAANVDHYVYGLPKRTP
jgi:hypothetical protein